METSTELKDQLLLHLYSHLKAYTFRWRRGNKTSLESFLDTHKAFRFSNGALVFAVSDKMPPSKSIYVSIGYNNPNIARSFTKEMLSEVKLVLPFVEFVLDDSASYVSDGWYNTELIAAILPTRNNIITELLKEL